MILLCVYYWLLTVITAWLYNCIITWHCYCWCSIGTIHCWKVEIMMIPYWLRASDVDIPRVLTQVPFGDVLMMIEYLVVGERYVGGDAVTLLPIGIVVVTLPITVRWLPRTFHLITFVTVTDTLLPLRLYPPLQVITLMHYLLIITLFWHCSRLLLRWCHLLLLLVIPCCCCSICCYCCCYLGVVTDGGVLYRGSALLVLPGDCWCAITLMPYLCLPLHGLPLHWH